MSERKMATGLAARETFVEHAGYVQPAPAPRFSRTVSAIQNSAAVAPVNISDILAGWSTQLAAFPSVRSAPRKLSCCG